MLRGNVIHFNECSFKYINLEELEDLESRFGDKLKYDMNIILSLKIYSRHFKQFNYSFMWQ